MNISELQQYLIKKGVESLREIGVEDVNESNILREHKDIFIAVLRNNVYGQSLKKIDKEIDNLIEQLKSQD